MDELEAVYLMRLIEIEAEKYTIQSYSQRLITKLASILVSFDIVLAISGTVLHQLTLTNSKCDK